jgi:V8-like Glu-specific endopeptidase
MSQISFMFTPVVDLTPASLAQQHRAAHHIQYDNPVEGDSCSATAVGPHTLLTAGHCLMASSKIKIDGTNASVVNMIFDDADHMFVVTDATFPVYLHINQNALDSIGAAQVHMWGNPGRSTDVYRIGSFLKWSTIGDAKLAIFVLPIFAGDSGSGLIDDTGDIIGVISVGNNDANAGILPLQFTDAQLAQIK